MEEIVARMLTLARAETSHHRRNIPPARWISPVAVLASAQQFQSMAGASGPVTIAPCLQAGAAFVGLPIEECSLLCSNLLLNGLQHSPKGY